MRLRRLAFAVVTIAALVVVWPTLTSVYSAAGDTFALSPWWLGAIVLAVVVQLAANFELHRIVLRTPRWLDVGAPILVGNAASHLAPGGSAVGAGVEVRMMTAAGFPLARVLTSIGAITMIGTVSGLVILPLLVLVASAAGSNVDADLVAGMWIGAAVLLLFLVGLLALARRDASWRFVARLVSRVQSWLHRPSDVGALEARLLAERELIRTTLRGRVLRVVLVDLSRALGDYVALYCALRATGAPVNPAAALAAFIVSNIAGMIPLTPGGLGFVEAGLAGVLTVAGATDAQADLTVATYRLAATWLPCVAGAIALVVFQRRHRERKLTELLTTP